MSLAPTTSGGGIGSVLGGLFTLTQAIGSLSQIASGFSTKKSADKEAKAMQAEAALVLEQARAQAVQKAREVTDFQSLQAHKYASSGMTLEGTPVLMLQRTRSLGQQEVDAIVSQGKAQSDLIKARSQILQNNGRASMLSGIMSGVGTLASGAVKGLSYGIYGGGLKSSLLAPYTLASPVYSPLTEAP